MLGRLATTLAGRQAWHQSCALTIASTSAPSSLCDWQCAATSTTNLQPALFTPAVQSLPCQLARRVYSVPALLSDEFPLELADGSVPVEIENELNAIQTALRKASHIDGRKRLKLTMDILQYPIPHHKIEPGLPTYSVIGRPDTGSTPAKWLRRDKRVPGRIQSLPEEKRIMMHMSQLEAEAIVRVFGRHGCLARPMRLNIVHPEDPEQVLGSIRVKPQCVHANAATLRIENIDFIYCPVDRIIKVDVPIKLVNDDISPGVKKGGWLFTENRTVRYECFGGSIPPFIEVDVGQLELNQTVRIKSLPIPPGTRIHVLNYDAVVVRCTTDVGKD